MTIKYSKSRKVNSYVKLCAKYAKLDEKCTEVSREMAVRYRALTGGQIAEANRLVGELGKPDVYGVPPYNAKAAEYISCLDDRLDHDDHIRT